MSRQIQALEQLLNARLFQRRHRQVELTRVGRNYLNEIRAPLAQLSAATVRVQSGSDDGALSICAYPTFAVRWFIPRWARFFDRHPDIDVRLTTSLMAVDFARDDYDLAIQILREGEVRPGQCSHKIVDVETTPVCAPDLAASLRRPEDLAAVTLLHGEPRPQDWARWLRFAGVDGVDAEKGLRFESLNLAIQAAIEGLGVAVGIEALLRDDLTQGRLVQPFTQMRRSSRPMHLVYPQAKAANPRLLAFRDWILAEAAR